MAQFGQFIKARRVALGISLRQFAIALGMDPSNYSKLERGEAVPPGEATIAKIASQLGIQPDSSEWTNMMHKAAFDRRELPAGLSEHALAHALPAFFARVPDAQTPEELVALFHTVLKENAASDA